MLAFAAQADFGLITLRTASPLTFQVLPSGAVYAVRHGPTLLNQVLPGPAENGLLRLIVREYAEAKSAPADEPAVLRWASLVGAGLPFSYSNSSATWSATAGDPATGAQPLHCTTTLELDPQLAAWTWRIRIQNPSAYVRVVDVLHAQDVGLADEGAIRNNEAYNSQYIDWLPVHDDQLGWALFARQNQPATGGRHPWLAFGCVNGATAFCTDGWQFFGTDHRLSGEPHAAWLPKLPSQRQQYEFALAGLQSRRAQVPPHGTAEFVFIARFLEDHPEASALADVARLQEIARPSTPATNGAAPTNAGPVSLFTTAPWLHGNEPTEADLAAWFPEPHRHIERGADQRPLAFFCNHATHVVTRTKEALVARPHGHVLRSGDATWIDDRHFGLTAYAAGIFSAQTYVANPSLARLLSVVRNALNVARASGQRVFVNIGGTWRQLGVPSAFAMTPGSVRWLYRIADTLVEARSWCSKALSAGFLDLRVIGGPAREFLITHQLALGANEFEHTGRAEIFRGEGWVRCSPGEDSLVGQKLPGTCFAIAADDAAQVAALGGDELLYADGERRNGPYVALRTKPVMRCGVIQIGTVNGFDALPALVASARAEFIAATPPSLPPALALRANSVADAGLARLNEVLPWLNHNASIHFSAPHGLEQYGGAAWGVRDVCQGSLEWLLTAGRTDIARRMLLTVFGQQYHAAGGDHQELTGTWPQWFMFPPFHFIQQAHSHGDVCFWPVKALCDYLEASNDFAFLDTVVGYTNPNTFAAGGPQESLWTHCERVVAHVTSRFAPGTKLVNYGDGDWDDTLQPADPSLRTRMISAWTVGLAYHTFRQFAEVCRRANRNEQAMTLDAMLSHMRADFGSRLMPDRTVAGFLVYDRNGEARPLLHPRDKATGIRYRLLPMTRSILAELFTPEEARRHLEIIDRELRYPDGVRLMSEPAVYHGGCEKLFKRAETAANVGREIGLQYVHAHLRYAEALAKVGDADRLWTALQTVNPVGLAEVVRNAALRQSNVYFSSSDADFGDRYEAATRWNELRQGQVPVRGGWRLYSSGPGLFLHTVRAHFLGIRESFGDVIFDPVLPRSLNGLTAHVELCGLPTQVQYRINHFSHGPSLVIVNGKRMAATRDPNPYRAGGLRVAGYELAALLSAAGNRIEVHL